MWTDEARAAAAAARQAKAQAQQVNPATRKRGPQTQAHPNPGQRIAFAQRNKMIHDAGKDVRIAAAHQAAIHAGIPKVGMALLKMFGTLGAIGGSVLGPAARGPGRGGIGRRS